MAPFNPGPPPDLQGDHARARLDEETRYRKVAPPDGERTRAQLDAATARRAARRSRPPKRPWFAPLRRLARAIRGGG